MLMPVSTAKVSTLPPDIARCPVLIVDDDPHLRAFLYHSLCLAGFNHVEAAVDGMDAWHKYACFQPHAVVTDVNMPNMDGIELCRRLSGLSAERPTILVLTANGGDCQAAFAAGASDFVEKPVMPAELTARLRVHLENRVLMRRLKLQHDHMAAELGEARDLQHSLLPQAAALDQLRHGRGLAVAAHFAPCSDLGGDCWGVRALDEHRTALFLADVSGHGVQAALKMVRLQTLLDVAHGDAVDPARLLGRLNRQLCAALPVGSFATLFYAVMDCAKNLLSYASAGMPPAYFKKARGPATALDTKGVPIGISAASRYPLRTLPFEPGDSLFLYSDALIESADRGGRVWSETEIGRALDFDPDANAARSWFQDFVGRFYTDRPPPLDDDLTMILLHRAQIRINLARPVPIFDT